MALLSTEIRRLRTRSLAHNAGWMLVGQGLNLVLQAGYFILLARLLGVRDAAKRRARAAYQWQDIVSRYAELIERTHPAHDMVHASR